MSEPTTPPTSPPPLAPSRWTEDEIFAVMSNPARRCIVKVLAACAGRCASDLRGTTKKRADATIKDCTALVKAGFLRMAPDPADGRRMLYTLDPAVPRTQTPTGWELDFGCCVLRL